MPEQARLFLLKKERRVSVVIYALFLFYVLLFVPSETAAAQKSIVVRAHPIRVMPHDEKAFTQGLFLDGGVLYESEGLYGRSRIVRREFPQGRFLNAEHLAPEYFGEGCAMIGGNIFLLTWKEEKAFVLDKTTLSLKKTLSYTGEGWGLTTDGTTLWRSDGSAVLTRHDATNFSPVGRIVARDNGVPVPFLNELEWVGGWLYANIWKSDKIAVIDPQSGDVVLWIDCSSLVPSIYTGEEGKKRMRETGACLNGIAWRRETDTLLITGKLWPVLYEIARPDIPR